MGHSFLRMGMKYVSHKKTRFHLLMRFNKTKIFTSALMESLECGATVLPTDRLLAAEHQAETD